MHVQITIEGASPLLCNRFTDAAALAVEGGTSAAVRGAKPPPKEQAAGKLYLDSNGKPVMPGPNFMRALIDAGRFIKTGKSALTTMKSSLVPAGLSVQELEALIKGSEWQVDSRSVVIPSTGGRIMAHRPRFDDWKISFTLAVDDTMFGAATIRELVDLAGQRIGLGDFRPARKGPFGRFKVSSWKVS